MTNELIKIDAELPLKNDIETLSLSEKGIYAMDLHNLKANLEEILEKIKEKEEELYSSISKSTPFKLDAEGKLLSTQIYDEATGEGIGCLEWQQGKKELLDEAKAIESLKAVGMEVENTIFYDLKPKTKTEIQKLLKGLGLNGEAIQSCFSKIERKEPKIAFKKF